MASERRGPLNLLEKIMLKCAQAKLTQIVPEKASCDHDQPNSTEIKSEDFELADVTKPEEMVEAICSRKGLAGKRKLLTRLWEMCKEDPALYEKIGTSSLVLFVDTLLKKYYQAICHHITRRSVVEDSSLSELILLHPLLNLLTLSANLSVHEIRERFLYSSELLLHLMQSAIQCSYNTARTHDKLQDSVLNKDLTGALFPMTQKETVQLFEKYFGFKLNTDNFKLQGYCLILFEENNIVKININKDILRNRPLSGKKYTGAESDSDEDGCDNVDSADWTYIAVARVLLLNTVLVYKREDWRSCLADICSQVQEILQMMDVNAPVEHKHQAGTLYGFWSSDGVFEGQSLMMVPCLRGQVMAITGDWAMLWAVDIGLICFVPKAKLYMLPEEVASQPWLISICHLQGGVCSMDEEFLKTSYKLLLVILETNTQMGKHILLFESGKHIPSLVEYPEISIRLTILDLLVCLAKNSKDITKFLWEQKFDSLLLGKLERYGHAYTAGLSISEEMMEQEIHRMVKILLLLVEQKEDINTWAESRRASRVIWMYICDKKCKWRVLMEKCLSLLSERSSHTPSQRGDYRNGPRRPRGQWNNYRNDRRWGGEGGQNKYDGTRRGNSFRGNSQYGRRYSENDSQNTEYGCRNNNMRYNGRTWSGGDNRGESGRQNENGGGNDRRWKTGEEYDGRWRNNRENYGRWNNGSQSYRGYDRRWNNDRGTDRKWAYDRETVVWKNDEENLKEAKNDGGKDERWNNSDCKSQSFSEDTKTEGNNFERRNEMQDESESVKSQEKEDDGKGGSGDCKKQSFDEICKDEEGNFLWSNDVEEEEKSDKYSAIEKESGMELGTTVSGALSEIPNSDENSGFLMRRVEIEPAHYRDHFGPYRPRLPKLNALDRPTEMPYRKPASYQDLLSLLDSNDDLPSARNDSKPVIELLPRVSLESDVDYVIYGSKVDVKPDKTHEFILEKKLWTIKEVVLAQKLCSLLNNNIDGSMYFGLNEDSIVEGIWFPRGDKDTFRNGIDRVMNRCLVPEVRATNYEIIFTPVLRHDDKPTDMTKQSLFIVEIRVHPLVHMVYMVYQTRKCYTRQGAETVEQTVHQRKQEMMDEEEHNLEESLKEMEAAAEGADLLSLLDLVKKYVDGSKQ